MTIPATLVEPSAHAKEQHLTISRALVALAERGVHTEAEAKEQLKASYNRFLAKDDPALKNKPAKRPDPSDLRNGRHCGRFSSLTSRGHFGSTSCKESTSDESHIPIWRRCKVGEAGPVAPPGDWYKEFAPSSSGTDQFPKNRLEKGMKPFGSPID